MENENFDIENVSEEDNSNPFAEGVKSDAADVSEEQTADDEKSSDDFSADETNISGDEDDEPEVEYITDDDDTNQEEPEVEFIDNSDEQEETEEPEVEFIDEEGEVSESEEQTEKPHKKNIFETLFSKKNQSAADLKKLKEECEKINNQYLRLAADFDNYRKRQVAEREALIKYGMEQALRKMIEVSDNFERAEKSLESIDDLEKAKEAFTILAKQFRESMKKLGLEEINAEGQIFDPNLHEAVMQTQTDEFPEDTVVQELQKGYMYGDKVLRPSMVSVAVN